MKVRADASLLLVTPRMECYMYGFNTAQICARIHFMSRPEWAQSHEINSTLKGHGKMAVIVHYIQVGVVWAS